MLFFLDFPEKAALIILSLAFIAAVVGSNVWKGLLSALLGMFFSYIGTGEDSYPRLSLGSENIGEGLPLISAVLGVLIIGEVLRALEEMWRESKYNKVITVSQIVGSQTLKLADIKRIFPYISISAFVGTIVGALPGIGSTLAATLGYASGRKIYRGKNWK